MNKRASKLSVGSSQGPRETLSRRGKEREGEVERKPGSAWWEGPRCCLKTWPSSQKHRGAWDRELGELERDRKQTKTRDRMPVLPLNAKPGVPALGWPSQGRDSPWCPCFPWQRRGAACLLPVWAECRPWGRVGGEVIWFSSIFNRLRPTHHSCGSEGSSSTDNRRSELPGGLPTVSEKTNLKLCRRRHTLFGSGWTTSESREKG